MNERYEGRNGIADFIPVARIADMLLNPGATYRYNGETRTQMRPVKQSL